ncbi:putative protein family UPF0642 [Moelleriella libera RCEF 2490]|uniref:DUF2423 domain-containing protein n=1 Tax=Moelleriella libera RCEF 2490 TaxID=1081109 RepID=A0A167Y1E7_9HYPO|nr:putative protein family UPF0642 [Moelleriella libera RCEF 2490]
MAKSARSSRIKTNNRRKYDSVFSPAEVARNERLSAKLLELAKQPKPASVDVNMEAMDLDSKQGEPRIGKKRTDRRKQKKSSIVFAKYSDRTGIRKKKKKQAGK